jgi:hypothetical protein
MKKVFFLLTAIISQGANAQLQYCSGKIVDLVSRNSHEGVQVRLELKGSNDTSNFAAILSPSSQLNDNQKVQISFLLSAYMAGKEVQLELNPNGYTFNSCSDFQNGLPIRFVRFIDV